MAAVDGAAAAAVRDPDPLAPTTQRLAAAGVIITPRTLPTWEGGPFNLGYAVGVLYTRPR